MIEFFCKLPLLNKIYRQGGIDSFKLAHQDIMLTMRDDLDKKAEELAKEKLNNLLSVVDERKVVTFSEKMRAVFIGGERANEATLLNLKAEAEIILTSNLWSILYESPKQLAYKAMFTAGESLDDMKKGRSILYTLDTQKRILETFKGYTQPTPVAPRQP